MDSIVLLLCILGGITLFSFCVVAFSKFPKKQNKLDVLELDKSTTDFSTYTSCLDKTNYIGWE